MNDPDLPPQFSPIPGVPPPPPKINGRMLWITLLAPSAVMVLVTIALYFFMENDVGGTSDELFFPIACAIVCIATSTAWGFFIHTILQRFHGTSLVLLILAYPILQGILVFGIFFVGCLAIVATGN